MAVPREIGDVTGLTLKIFIKFFNIPYDIEEYLIEWLS